MLRRVRCEVLIEGRDLCVVAIRLLYPGTSRYVIDKKHLMDGCIMAQVMSCEHNFIAVIPGISYVDQRIEPRVWIGASEVSQAGYICNPPVIIFEFRGVFCGIQ